MFFVVVVFPGVGQELCVGDEPKHNDAQPILWLLWLLEDGINGGRQAVMEDGWRWHRLGVGGSNGRLTFSCFTYVL